MKALIIAAALSLLLALACFSAASAIDPGTRAAWVATGLLAAAGLLWIIAVELRRRLREAQANIDELLALRQQEREARWTRERVQARERIRADLDFSIRGFAPREKETDPNAKTLP